MEETSLIDFLVLEMVRVCLFRWLPSSEVEQRGERLSSASLFWAVCQTGIRERLRRQGSIVSLFFVWSLGP